MVATAAALALLVPATAACLAYLAPTLAGLLRRGASGSRLIPGWMDSLRSPPHPPPRGARRRPPPPGGRSSNTSPLEGEVAAEHREAAGGGDGQESSQDGITFAVLIPAHDEEATLPAALRSVAAQDYPGELVRVYVVADNCADGTAAVARAAGAVCVVRTNGADTGKGYAVAAGVERVLRDSPDVVLMLDADYELNPGALRELDAAFAAGADAVQCAVVSRNADDGPGGYVAAVGAAVDAAVAAGLDRLGRSVPLRGTGMAFRRAVLEAVPWRAFGLAEDAEYAGQLRAAGVRVRHSAAAKVTSDAPAKLGDLWRQRRRWRAAGVLGSKPLALTHLAVTAAVAPACGFVGWPAVLVALTGAVYLRAVAVVGLTRRRLGLLVQSPLVVLRLGWLTLAGVFGWNPETWDRTPRPNEDDRRAA